MIIGINLSTLNIGLMIRGRTRWQEAEATSTVGRRFPNWNFFVNREKGLFLSVYVDDIKLAGKKQYINPTWKIQMKDFDLGEPTSFLEKRMSDQQGYCGKLQKYVRIRDFCRGYRKIATHNIHGEI